MKFKEILGKVSNFTDSPLGEILTSLVPGLGVVGSVVDTANDIFGGNSITENTTVGELSAKIAGLPPGDKARIMEAEVSLEIAKVESYAEVAIAQEQNNNSTRPKIAMKMADLFVTFAFTSFAFLLAAMIADVYLVRSGDDSFIFKIAIEGLPWLAGTYAIPAMGIMERYFARRSDDKRTAASLAGVEPPVSKITQITQALSALRKK